jgi:hypothetical protein
MSLQGTSRQRFRYECACGKQICSMDRKTRDMSFKLHKKVCEIAENSETLKIKTLYTAKREIKYQGQLSVGEKASHEMTMKLNQHRLE